MAVVMANGVRSVAMVVVKASVKLAVMAVAVMVAVAAEAKVAGVSGRTLQHPSFARPAKPVGVANRDKTAEPKAVWTTPKQTLAQHAKGAVTALNVAIGHWLIAQRGKVAVMVEMRVEAKPVLKPKTMAALRLKPSSMPTAQKFVKNGHRAKSATPMVAANVVAKVVVNAENAASVLTVTRTVAKTIPKTPIRRLLSRASAPATALIRAWHERAAHPASPQANAANADRVTATAAIAANARAMPLAKTTMTKKARGTRAARLRPCRAVCPM